MAAYGLRRFGLVLVPLIGLAVAFETLSSLARADTWRLKLIDQRERSGDMLVIVEAPAGMAAGHYRLASTGSARPTTAQVFTDGGKLWFAAILSHTQANQDLDLELASDAKKTDEPEISLTPSGPNMKILIGGSLFSEYRTDVGAKPFLFPLVGPTGASLTRAYPMEKIEGEDFDHPHQRSFWFTHGKVNGIDFWSEQSGHGVIRETERTTVLSGPVIGRLRTTDDWLGPDGRKICEDERVLTMFQVGTTRMLDFEIAIKATAGPVVFGDTKEGMFGVRVASSMDVDRKRGGRITNAEGLHDAKAWGKASAWVDYSGPVQGKMVGITIMNHPRSFRFPTTWHVRTYGLFAANPFGWHDFGLGKTGEHKLEAGRELWFGYRVILHEGQADSVRIAGAFEDYRDPPRVVFSVEVESGTQLSCRLIQCDGVTTPSTGSSCGSAGSSSTTWQSNASAQYLAFRLEPRQEPVIITGAAAQPVAMTVKYEARHERPIDLLGLDGQAVRFRFGDLERAGFQIHSRILDLEQPHELLLSLYLGSHNSLASFQGVNEERLGLDLFRECLGVEQDGARFGIPGKRLKEPDQRSLLNRSLDRIKRQDSRPGGTPQVFLELHNRNTLLHQGLARSRSDAISGAEKMSPCRPRKEVGTGQSNLHRNAVGALLRTRSSGGTLRPSRNRNFKRPMLGPYGSHVGSPKGPLRVEHGRG